MSTTIHNPDALGKFGSLIFARQPRHRAAPRHGSLLASFKAWYALRSARRELERLSDRNLADIGLTRSDIPRVLVSGR